MAELATVVYVDGKAYGPGKVPARIAKQITNPKVWASDDVSTEPAPDPEPPADAEPPANVITDAEPPAGDDA